MEDDRPRLLTDEEVEEIRRGLDEGHRGPEVAEWARQLLADRDVRVGVERRLSPEALRARYGHRQGEWSQPDRH